MTDSPHASVPTPVQQPARPPEQLLIAALPRFQPVHMLCTSLGRGQLAAAAARLWPASRVRCLFLDAYLAQQAEQAHRPLPANLQLDCLSDFPEGEADLVALPTTSSGDAELTRDLIQTGYERLKIGGTLLVATNNPHDRWLKEQIERIVSGASSQRAPEGMIYWGIKRQPLKKQKRFTCEFAFRDEGRLIRAFSRPGVFSHRRVDGGARALMEAMTIPAGARVLELGCGSGVVSLAAAVRAPGVTVTSIDSNPRAVDCTRRGAELNGCQRVSAKLDADARCESAGAFDVVLANPPYYSHFRIGEIFVQGAATALRRGGKLFLVTKHPDEYIDRLGPLFSTVSFAELRGYFVVCGQK